MSKIRSIRQNCKNGGWIKYALVGCLIAVALLTAWEGGKKQITQAVSWMTSSANAQ